MQNILTVILLILTGISVGLFFIFKNPVFVILSISLMVSAILLGLVKTKS